MPDLLSPENKTQETKFVTEGNPTLCINRDPDCVFGKTGIYALSFLYVCMVNTIYNLRGVSTKLNKYNLCIVIATCRRVTNNNA